MGLAETQRVLARLCTEAAFRERFFADPRGTGGASGLRPDEAESLARTPAEQVHRFARSLHRKRLRAVDGALPLTRRALGQRFAALFGEFAGARPTSGPMAGRPDARGFSAFIAHRARAGRIEPGWVGDLARYEAAWLTAGESRRRWMIRWFRHPVPALVRHVGQADDRPPPPPRPTIGVWCRLSRRGRIRHVVLSLPSFRRRGDRCRA